MKTLELLEGILDTAKKAGAEAADACFEESRSTSIECRGGKLESAGSAETGTASLRVFVGSHSARVSASDFDGDAIAQMVEHAIALARHTPENPYAGLVDNVHLAQDLDVDLSLWDNSKTDPETLLEVALEMERAALEVQGVTKCSAATASYGFRRFVLCTSKGFEGEALRTNFSRACVALASDDHGMEMGFDFSAAVHIDDLAAASAIGELAGTNAARKLGSRKISTGQIPVVFAPSVSNTLIQAFANAISGPSVVAGTSFLKECMGQRVFGEHIRIVDDPRRPRGLASRVFDAEGVPCTPSDLVRHGELRSWMLNYASAAQLDLPLTGHGGKLGDVGGPSNLYLEPGESSLDELIQNIERGFYVTDLMGGGANTITGGYSSGASGHLIEKGTITYPVKEATIAGNLIDMFKQLAPADDLDFKYLVNAPTIRVDGMTVAGN